MAILDSNPTSSVVGYTFRVDSVTHASLPHDPGADVVTCSDYP